MDEEVEPRASGPQYLARLAAEAEWLRLGADLGIPAHVFRLGGIYGPGRR